LLISFCRWAVFIGNWTRLRDHRSFFRSLFGRPVEIANDHSGECRKISEQHEDHAGIVLDRLTHEHHEQKKGDHTEIPAYDCPCQRVKVEVTVSGISSDQILLADIMAASVTAKTLHIEFPLTTGNITGSFLCSSFEQTGEHDGAAEFTATFMSTGTLTYAATNP